ncbi:MAG: YesL family protein [Suilimivivens sp.]
MGKIFDLDSPLMNGLNKLADLIWLNILTVICCIPIITIGASMTALHYVVLKMVKDEESYITKAYFKSFKQNFRQATLIWLILLGIMLLLVGDFIIFRFSGIAFPWWFQAVLLAIAILVLFATMHLFPLLSRYENSIKNTYKNSLFMGILNLPKTILMMLCWVIPGVIILYFDQILPIVLVLGISGPAFMNALLYKKSFQRFEPETEETADEDWTIEENPEEEMNETEGAEEEKVEETTETIDSREQ